MERAKLLATILIALTGWGVVHWLNLEADREFRQREIRLEYLLTAYRNLEQGTNREIKSEAQNLAFESAIADILLLGTPEQVRLIEDFARHHAQNKLGNIEAVLESLRKELRQEIGLEDNKVDFFTLRFKRDT